MTVWSFEVYGGDVRLPLAYEFASKAKTAIATAEGLIRSFVKFDGTYSANHVEVLAEAEEDGSCFLVRFSFELASDPHEFGYTYYDVYLSPREPPELRFHPTKFVVGFW